MVNSRIGIQVQDHLFPKFVAYPLHTVTIIFFVVNSILFPFCCWWTLTFMMKGTINIIIHVFVELLGMGYAYVQI